MIDKKLKAAEIKIDPAVSALDATNGFAEFLMKQDEGHVEGYSPKESVLNIDASAKSEGLEAKWCEGDDGGMPVAVGAFTIAGGNQIGGVRISPDGKAIFFLNGERFRGDYYFASADNETQDAAMKELAVIIKAAKEKEERAKQVDETNRLIEVGKNAVPGVRLQDAEEAGKLWEMKGRGELSEEDWGKYVEDLKASNKIAKSNGPQALIGSTMISDDEKRILAELANLGEEELTRRHEEIRAYMEGPDFEDQDPDYKKSLQNTEFLLFTAKSNVPDEPVAVTVLNDILAGKYDGDSTKLGEALDQAASDLEKDGKAEQYDALLNQAADYLTEILKKEAA
jgi:hypothetical protein